MAQRILVVEDERDILDLLGYNLRGAGFEVDTATDGRIALEKLAATPPDLLLLDLMLPEVDGLEVCRVVRREEATRLLPIIVLTARTDELDRVVALELGADDFMVKPFSIRELVLRIRAVLRRSQGTVPPPEDGETIRHGPLVLEPAGPRALLNGQALPLTVTEFRLLLALARRPGRVRSREELLSTAWGHESQGYDRTVDTHVRRLRAKLGEAHYLVETVRGVGYRFRREAG
ncbi:MAG: response regulator transcription factor [Candidatus Latescibacterota bacterium]